MEIVPVVPPLLTSDGQGPAFVFTPGAQFCGLMTGSGSPFAYIAVGSAHVGSFGLYEVLIVFGLLVLVYASCVSAMAMANSRYVFASVWRGTRGVSITACHDVGPPSGRPTPICAPLSLSNHFECAGSTTSAA